MPGANYMGGRRNVMKARAKDTVGRQQKGHFGRQRLDILSKGISATKPSETGRAGQVISTLHKSSALDIDLAHAHANARTKIQLDDTASVRSFIPSPIRVTPRTPRSHYKARMRASRMHIPDPDAGRSKVLDAVDLSEALFLRRIADQILAMPNLACLPDRNSSRTGSGLTASQMKKVTPNKKETPPRNQKRKMSPLDDDQQDPRRKLSVYEKPVLPVYRSQDLCTPPPKKKQHLESSYSNTSSQHSLYQNHSSVSRGIPSSTLTDEKRDYHSVEDSEFDSDSDSQGIRAILRSSSLWSPENRHHSSRTSFDDDIFQSEHRSESIAHDDAREIIEDPQSSSEEESSQAFVRGISNDENPSLPSAIVFGSNLKGQRHKSSKNSTHHPTVYGSLFEREDPWTTIGIILGLPEVNSTKNAPKYSNGVDQAPVSDMDYDEQGSDAQLGQEVDQEWELEMAKAGDDETEDEEAPDIVNWEWEVQSPTTSTYKRVSDDEPAVRNDFQVDDTPFHDDPVNLNSVSFPQAEHKKISGVYTDVRVTEECVVALIALDASGKDMDDQRTAETSLSTSPSPDFPVQERLSPRSTVPERLGEHVMNVDNSDHGGRAGVPAGDKILGTPELREEGGRFLGPSLFDTFDESEDE